jgi:hypothetical protein
MGHHGRLAAAHLPEQGTMRAAAEQQVQLFSLVPVEIERQTLRP